jgi:anti-sigma B factor antagonist
MYRHTDHPYPDDPGSDHLHVDRRMEGTVVVVHAAGEVDVATAPLLREQLRIAITLTVPPTPVVADLRDVEFFGSNGIAVLIEAERSCHEHRTTLRLLATQPVTYPLDILGMQDAFTLCPTLDDALSA